MNRFNQNLQKMTIQNQRRTLNRPDGIDLSSNDYLALRTHPDLKKSAINAIEKDHVLGAGGSRLLRGHTIYHEELETFAAQYFGAEKSLFFANGYQANSAIFGSLPSRHDIIIYDELIHASAREAIQNSAAKAYKFKHNDLETLETLLQKHHANADILWIVTESVFSMDGDIAPLTHIQEMTNRYNAYLVIDEAHATGIFGNNGKGLAQSLSYKNIITLHTCGKALGVSGGIICAESDIINTLINTARPFIFSTAPPPLQAILVKRALELIQEEPERRQKLKDLLECWNTLMPDYTSESQIIPIIIGENKKTLQIAATLQNQGYDIRAIRPPTIPKNTARLRVSLNININRSTLENFTKTLNAHL